MTLTLDCSRKTIHRALKRDGHPEVRADGRYEIAAWKAFVGLDDDDDGDDGTIYQKFRNLN